MAQLTNLPDEIIDSICFYLNSDRLNPNTARLGLYSLLFASKKLNQIAIPHLYHSLSPASVAAGLLALTVLRNPSLAALVRTVDLEDYWPVESPVDRAARTTFIEEAGDLIACPETQVVEREDADLRETDEDREDRRFHRRFTDFVLTRLPLLEVLTLTLSEQLIDPVTINALRLGSQSALLNARELTIRHWDTEYGFEMSEIMPFLKNNTITNVNLFACAEFGDATQICPSVKSLRLYRSALEINGFESLVRCFPNLEILALETADSTVTQCMDDTPSTFRIGLDLRPLRGTLRRLTIDQRDRFDMSEDNDDGPYSKKPVGPLKDFDKLEELMIWQFDLTRSHEDEKAANPDADEDEEEEEEEGLRENGIEDDEGDRLMPWVHKLPRSLQTLGIIGASKEIEPELWRLSEIAGQGYPNLKKVISDRRVRGLKAAFQKTGIEYRVEKQLTETFADVY